MKVFRPHEITASKSLVRIIWTQLLGSWTIKSTTSFRQSVLSTLVATRLLPASDLFASLDPLTYLPCDKQKEVPGLGSGYWGSGSSAHLAKCWTSLGKPPLLWAPFCHLWGEVPPKPLIYHLSSFSLKTVPHPFHCPILNPSMSAFICTFLAPSNLPAFFRSPFSNSIYFLLPSAFSVHPPEGLGKAEQSGSGMCFSSDSQD